MSEGADYLDWPAFGLDRTEKRRRLGARLAWLTDWHRHHCDRYAAVVAAQGDAPQSGEIEAVPFLPVRLFKQYALRSVQENEVVKVLTSSGTTGQAPSRIYLDRQTAAAQSAALTRIVQDFVGAQRRPMLIVDSPSVITSRSSYSARGAGVVGLSIMGRDHTYALDANMVLDDAAVAAFAERNANMPVFVVGFTFMVWEFLIRALEKSASRIPLAQGTLLHSGGWKKLIDQSVDDVEFRARLAHVTGISSVHNYYGMVEQVGSIFMACEKGYLHAPAFADVIVRNAKDWRPCPVGQEGIIQVVSALPMSYPGHSLLTEDVGALLGEDDCACGRLGKYFSVRGRIPAAEMRGCSDTFQS